MNHSETKTPLPIQDACAPYHKTSLCCLAIDLVIALSITLLFFLAGAGWFLLIVLPLWFVGGYFLHHRLALLARRERLRGETVTVTVDILGGNEDRTPAGYFGSVLRELYPKSLRVSRYRIFCRAASGEKLMLRAIMSEQKWQAMRECIDSGQLKARTVIYGQKSRILLRFSDRGEPMDTLNYQL